MYLSLQPLECLGQKIVNALTISEISKLKKLFDCCLNAYLRRTSQNEVALLTTCI